MNEKYLPKTPEGRRWHLVEECSEVAKEVAKIGRFGLDSHCPLTGETNVSALLNEIADLRRVLDLVEQDLLDHAGATT